MQRLVRNRQGVLHLDLYDGDTLADADALPVVEVLRADGTVLSSGNAVKVPATTGEYTYEPALAELDELGPLVAEWTLSLNGLAGQVFRTYHELVGGPVVELGVLRKFEPLDDDSTYDDASLALVRDLAIYALEDECRTAFVRRRRTDVMGELGKYAVIERTRGATLASVSDGGTALDAASLAALRFGKGGLVMGRAAWHAPASLTYDYGYEVPPPRVARAVCLLAAEWAQENFDPAIPSRATLVTSDAGTMRLVTAGEFGRGFDIPEVNAVVQAYRE